MKNKIIVSIFLVVFALSAQADPQETYSAQIQAIYNADQSRDPKQTYWESRALFARFNKWM